MVALALPSLCRSFARQKSFLCTRCASHSSTSQSYRSSIFANKWFNKNLSLQTVAKHGTSTLSMDRTRMDLLPFDEEKRPLTVLLTWLGAQDKNIEKYRSLWLDKGFDVLTVKLSPQEFLMPQSVSIPLVQELIKFLYLVSPKYPDLLFHCFSVGSYEFGEMIYNLNDEEFINKVTTTTGSSVGVKETIESCIKGIIFDSATDFESIAEGVSKAFTLKPTVQKPLQLCLKMHLKLCYPIAAKYYARAFNTTRRNYLKVPTLLISSHKDTIAPPSMSARYSQEWRSRGIDVTEKVFNDSYHVQHMHKYAKDYTNEVDAFLSKVSLSN